MASSSSTSSKRCKYDVFLNFRGQDTRNTFTGHLYQALCSKGVNTFIDDKLERGEEISPALFKVIEESTISIVVFSENYAQSSYCLDELVKILKCKASQGQMVFPVFYNVDPSHVEKQNDSFGEAMFANAASGGVNKEKVQEWRDALKKAARLPGWHLDSGLEAIFIQSIVERILTKLNRTSLHVAEFPVGLDPHVLDMKAMLDIGSNEVRMVGICGIGGVGKTTIAKAIYNLIHHEFEGSCFLPNVREIPKQNGLVQLQEKLLFEILGDKNLALGSVDRGINVIRERLCNKKVLIVIDGVDHLDQLKKLAGETDWFGMGSRIIVTTRDERLLVVHGVQKLHKVKELSHDDAFQLFSWNAFKNPHPPEEYLELSFRVVQYAKGLPLALNVLGSFLKGRTIIEWKSELDRLKRIPNKEIYEVLKISFDGLEDDEKAIFLDIACFLKGKEKVYVSNVLDACFFNPDIGIQVLKEKSLIYIENNKLQMHDLLQSMGRQVVRQESPSKPSRRSRLCFHEDILHVLTENMGSNEIEGIMLDLPEAEKVHLDAEAFAKMKRLRIFIVRNAHVTGGLDDLSNELRWLEWPGFPFESMPARFHARKLVALNMHRSRIRQLGEGFKNFMTLKYMDFGDCEFLTETPDFSTIPNLERLNLQGCTSLVKIHQSIGFLEKLVFLSLEFCSNLRSLSTSLRLRSLQTLLLTGCSKLEKFPNILDKMTSIEKVCLDRTAIIELPWSIENLSGVKSLSLSFCKNLKGIPSSIYKLQHLKLLLLEGCSVLDKFPKNVGNKRPRSSSAASSKSSNASIGFRKLKCLDLRNCNLSEVDFLGNPDCFSLLRDLDLSGNNFVNLPACISSFTNLTCLKLANCKQLREIARLPRKIKSIRARDCKSLERYSHLTMVFKFSEERSTMLRDLDFSNCHKLAENLGRNLTTILESRSQFEKFRKDHRIEVFIPGSEMPECFNYDSKSDGGFVSFEVSSHMYGKLKALVLCTILRLEDGTTANISREIFINGQNVSSFSRQFFLLESDHLWLYYLPCHFIRGFSSLKQDDLNHFEVSFKVLGAQMNATLKRSGVYLVYKEAKKLKNPLIELPSTESISECNGSNEVSKTSKSASLDLSRSCNDEEELDVRVIEQRNKNKNKNKPKRIEVAFSETTKSRLLELKTFNDHAESLATLKATNSWQESYQRSEEMSLQESYQETVEVSLEERLLKLQEVHRKKKDHTECTTELFPMVLNLNMEWESSLSECLRIPTIWHQRNGWQANFSMINVREHLLELENQSFRGMTSEEIDKETKYSLMAFKKSFLHKESEGTIEAQVVAFNHDKGKEKMTEGYIIKYNNDENQYKQTQIDDSGVNEDIVDMEYSLTLNHDKEEEEITEEYLIECNNGDHDQCKHSQTDDLSINEGVDDSEYSFTLNHEKEGEKMMTEGYLIEYNNRDQDQCSLSPIDLSSINENVNDLEFVAYMLAL